MGRTNGLYNCEFPVATLVRIAKREYLEQFKRDWKYHHKITSEQIEHHDKTAVVERVGYYHGADELYELRGVPGIWHEQCLNLADPRQTT